MNQKLPRKKQNSHDDNVVQIPLEFLGKIEEEIDLTEGEWEESEEFEGAVGRTMFDTPQSKDNTITVLLPKDNISEVPAQSLVRIHSRDDRKYLGMVVEGPFAEPDGLRADSPIVVTTTVRGTMFMPKYHGRVQVGIIGEEVDDTMEPPRFRPLPNSPVFVVDENETHTRLGLGGDIHLGLAIGFEDMKVGLPSDTKLVLPRHLGILGTTGGGKSTTMAGLMYQFNKHQLATIVIDTEGEYTEIGLPTDDPKMKKLLERRGRKPEAVNNLQVFHLIGRETTATKPTPIAQFTLEFSSLSPYVATEILDLSDAQNDRFFKAYDVAKLVFHDLSIYPKKGDSTEELAALELDEFETGYPRLTLSHLIDICGFFLEHIGGTEANPYNGEFKSSSAKAQIKQRIATIKTDNERSWRALLSKLWRLHRLKVFDNPQAKPIPFDQLIKPGKTTVIDLSDTNSRQVINLVITNILRGLQEAQEAAYQLAEKNGSTPTPVEIIIEEAHEFLSRDRISKMPNLFEQVARISRRGRKRWLGLVFVTQLPQHLPDEVLGLINNYILHKIADSNVISRLKRSIGGVEDNLWNRLPNLAPGQAIVKAESMSRPMLVAIDPAPCKLRMID